MNRVVSSLNVSFNIFEVVEHRIPGGFSEGPNTGLARRRFILLQFRAVKKGNGRVITLLRNIDTVDEPLEHIIAMFNFIDERNANT